MKTVTVDYQEYEKLCQEIWHHNNRYFVDSAPTISDEEFDALMNRVKFIESIHPEWVGPYSPTQRVGEALTEGFKTIVHKNPMLSLANTYTEEELADFIKRIEKLATQGRVSYSVELKMDGIAVSVIYRNGLLAQASTRGDGKQGDDITANIKTIRALPLRLYGDHIPDYLEVRGEVFMPHKTFKKLNEQRAAAGEPLWANPRNAAAGSLKLIDPQEVAKRGLNIVFYGIAEESSGKVTSQFASHAFLKKIGLPILPHIAHCNTLEEIWAFAQEIRQKRPTLPFDIDGIVVKLDDIHEQKRLGVTGKNPRWAVAYKFAAEQAMTRVVDITVQVGRTGVLTPVAELEPVVLAGSTISRATLHNEEEVQRKDIRIGDMVSIEKGGDVIPKVVRVNEEFRPKEALPWTMPKKCPSCGSQVVRVSGEVAVRCPNTEHCHEQVLRRIIHFASKDAMDIDNMGEKVVAQLVANGFVKKPSDIYALTYEQIFQLTGYKEKSVENLIRSIDKSRTVSLPRFIMALGIKYVGEGTADMLAQRAGDIQTLAHMTLPELLQIEGVGEKVAAAVHEFFQDKENCAEVKRLLELGVQPSPLQVKTFVNHPFNGKNFVLTGTLHKYTRQTAASLIKERGGKVTDAVSRKTDYLLVGESAGSKLEKAQELGVKILEEKEFEQLL